MPPTPLQEIEQRIEKLQSAMAENGLNGALIVERADLFYFSGTGQDAHLFVPVDGKPMLMVRRSFERAIQDCPLEDVFPVTRFADLKDAVLSRFPGTLSSLGMELDVLPVNNYRVYERLFPDAAIVDASPLIKSVRMIKSPYEVDLIREAARMSDGMFSQVKHLLTDGITELEFASRVEAVQHSQGHQGYVRVRAFNREASTSHVMSGSNLAAPSCSPGPTGGMGPNASFPYGAGHKIINKHEPVQIDNAAVAGGYIIDQSRTFSVGRLSDKLLRIHDTAVNIQETIVKLATPGIEAEKLYNTALKMADDAGLGDFFMGWGQPVPFVGHGIGIELDELPVIGKKSKAILMEGMVLAIEPKFILPGEGLSGIENSYLITSNGAERLTLFDDAIEIVG